MRARKPGAPRYLVAHPGAELYGSDRVMLESVVAFSEAGAAVTVTVPETGPLVDLLRDAGASVRIRPNLVLRKSLLRPRNWLTLLVSSIRGLRASWRLLKEIRPDAVYVSTVTIPLWPALAWVARIPVVLHLHEAEQDAPRLVKWAIYAPAVFAQRIVVNSEFSRRVLGQAFPALARRAQTVYNGVAGPPTTTPAPTSLGSVVKLVYVGRLSPRKGPDLIVEALARIDDPRLRADFVGAVFTGYEWYEQQLRQRIDELGLGGRVRLWGFRSDVWTVIDDGQIVIVPSRLDEPFGNTAVEGTLAGRVVLVSDTSGLREATAGVGTARLFAPDDVDALARAITSAVEDWDRLQPLLASEGHVAAQRFSPARYRRDISEVMMAIRMR